MIIPIRYLKGVFYRRLCRRALGFRWQEDARDLEFHHCSFEAGVERGSCPLAKCDLSAKRYVYLWTDGIHLEASLED
ncbi:hypothetical protein MesoLj113a_73200 [Mesorhizobium sp. 113-1-2]|nr:hypothetical protein MesoLj113a_73200 [Mesorhizobium sp. 113-1-2]